MGLLPVNGIMPYSHALDTLGFFTQAPQDSRMLTIPPVRWRYRKVRPD